MNAYTDRPRNAHTRRPRTQHATLHFLRRVGIWTLCTLSQDLPARELRAGQRVWVRRSKDGMYELLDDTTRTGRGRMSARQAMWALSLLRAPNCVVLQNAGPQLNAQLDSQWLESLRVMS